jgi:aryl carrier-like protein
VERDPAEQGFPGGTFDAIVATNVVHATRDVEATLRRLRSLLAPGGVLILGEATTHLSWFDVTTGLIEGWQRFEDASRGDSPLLAPAAWDRALRAAGFDAVACLPEPGSAATVLGQHVLIARVPASAGDVPAGAPSETVAAEPEPSTPVVPVGDVARRLAEARPADRHALALEYVTLQVAAVLRVSRAETLDPRQRLMDLGLDSLMALELRGRLALGLGLAGGLPATLVFEHPTIDAVARYLVRETVGAREPIPDARRHEPATSSPDEAAARIAHLSEEEVEALLVKKLENL